MDQLSFAVTSDGSKTLFNAEVGEHYHSKHGALQESKHVFLNAGLKHFLQHGDKKASILEVGFGTGLNFLVTADYSIQNQIELEYTGIEAYPLSTDIISSTGYDSYISSALWKSFIENYQGALNNEIILPENIKLSIASMKLLSFATEKKYDIIYFDAFAAIHQPEMWDDNSLAHVSQFLNSGGIFVTYAITGNLKRTMKSLGFRIEKVPGAPGKREMLRATKL